MSFYSLQLEDSGPGSAGAAVPGAAEWSCLAQAQWAHAWLCGGC